MKIGKYRNLDGELITIPQAGELINSGRNTVLRLAEESGAVRRIGRNYRIHRKIFLDYIEQTCSE